MSRLPRTLVVGGIVATLLAVAATVGAVEPRLDLITPRGGQRGTEAVLTLRGARLKDASDLVAFGPGLSLVSFEEVGDERVTARVRIAADCPLGQHGLRLLTKTGISELRSFHVGPFVEIEEQEPNDAEHAQTIELERTVSGTMKDGDADVFSVDLKRGERFSAEVEAVRLGNVPYLGPLPIADMRLTLTDSSGGVVASCDDTAFSGPDPVLSLIAPADGRYQLELRDSIGAGSDRDHYRLHVGTFPRPTAMWPPGGRIGTSLTASCVLADGTVANQTFDLPKGDDGYATVFPKLDGQEAPTPNRIRVSEFADVSEREPNDSAETATEAKLETPFACNGVVSQPGDVDHFALTFAASQNLNVRVYSATLGAPVDTVVSVLDENGAVIAEGDDSEFMDDMALPSSDSFLRFPAVAGRRYVLRVASRGETGGPDHVYRVEISPIAPWLALYVREQVTYSQERLAVAVPRGNRFLTMLGVRRGNIDKEITLANGTLPPGVRCDYANVPPGVDQIPMVFSAEEEAALGAGLTTFDGRITEDPNVTGRLNQVVALSVGTPGYTLYSVFRTDKLAVAVIDAVPFRVDLVPPKAPLVKNGAAKLKVVVTRHEGFAGPVEVQFPFRPPGVGAAPSIEIPKGETVGHYPLTADGNAITGDWKVAVSARARIDGGSTWVSSDLVELQVAEPYVDLKLKLAATEPGSSTRVLCNVSTLRPFEGKATARLDGLPPGVTAKPVEFEKDATSVSFDVEAASDSPTGKFNLLFCEVEIEQDGETVVQQVGHGGVLRIDPPSPDGPQPGGEETDLSRLEQLRRQYRAHAEARDRSRN